MRISFVVPGDFDTTSGGFRYDRRLVASLREAGDDVTVHSVPWRRYPLGAVDASRHSLARLAAGADVVVVDELAHPTFAFASNGAFGTKRTPVVALVHHLRCDEGGVEAPLARTLERRFLGRVDAAICTSSATARSVREAVSTPGGRQRRESDEDIDHDAPALPTVVAPPTDDQFDPDVTTAAVDDRATVDPFRVVFLGSIVPRKRPLALVDALAGLDGAWRATLVGPQPNDRYVDRVHRRCRRRGVEGRVTLTGPLPTDEVAAVLERGHVLALPSRHEGFGIAYLEGMGFGLPAVATHAGGATDLVTHGETGFLVPPEGVGAVAAALSTLASDRARLARMGRAALRRYDAHPPWTETIARIRSFLTAVVDGASGADASVGGGVTG
ncbi:glycosyltransferase family 4 protein [Salinigranum salinum]|uniref:glycosyltransferase family 4 protein n=1 Tax=Salinigranum salinum TaxID=1364937 RepID=UPI001260AB76|nr:glycosyltransferase family 4 protein [Salinigranum salinum]